MNNNVNIMYYCKFIIKREELIYRKNRVKLSLQILRSCSYFSDSFELYDFFKLKQNICARDFIFS